MRPYYSEDGIEIWHCDCREFLPTLKLDVDAVITDPPYGDTSLDWDQPVKGWLSLVDAPQIWCFGSMRFWLEHGSDFREDWSYGQEVVWEKHNGSGFHADRFKRVHEFAVQWYRGPWGDLPLTPPLTGGHRRIRASRAIKNGAMAHTGGIGQDTYDSTERLTRSVLRVRSEHRRAVHPTQKPLGILTPLITYSVPSGGVVLDPFAGSGSTLVAARLAGRRAVGIEICEEYCEVAATRLAQGVFDLEAAA